MVAVEDETPAFIKVAHEMGAVVVVASDETRAEWTRTTIPTLHPWDGEQLRVRPAGRILETHKVHIWVSKYLREYTAAEVLMLFST